MDLQALVNALGESGRMTRSRYQMTLGKMLRALEGCDADMPVVFGGADTGSPGDAHSYRGYYSDLSFEPSHDPVTVAEFKKQCSGALGTVYEGYKGGDFTMTDDTPLWCAGYSHCGNAIIDLSTVDGKVVLNTKDVEGG